MDTFEISLKNTEINLKKISFIYKLWIVTNSKNNSIEWNSKGDLICINIKILTKYLRDLQSIFICKNVTDFLSIMVQFGFRMKMEKNANNTIEFESNDREDNFSKIFNSSKWKTGNINLYEFIYCSNSNFQRGNFDLLKNLLKSGGCNFNWNSEENIKDVEMKDLEENQNFISKKSNFDRVDPTYQRKYKIDFLTQKKQFLTITLKRERCLDILRAQAFPYNNSAVIPIPADIFKSSSESVSGFEEKLEYAGFYGNSLELFELQNIFGNYLPVYLQSNDDSGDVEMHQMQDGENSIFDIDNTEILKNPIESSGSDAFTELNSSGVNTMQCKISSEDLIKAAPLEPIFNPDSTGAENDDDISMDLYLKFNKKEETFEIKVENTNDDLTNNKNEATNCDSNDSNGCEDYSFKSFFSQYSNSMNVLLEE